MIYGQWKQAVCAGIRTLAAAYVITGDPVYVHKAGILLDRVADLYPTFDHSTQSWVYDKDRTAGYVSTWYDACEETRELAMAYDQVRDGLQGDAALVAFLGAIEIKLKHLTEFVEIRIDARRARIVAGDSQSVENILIDGSIWCNRHDERPSNVESENER